MHERGAVAELDIADPFERHMLQLAFYGLLLRKERSSLRSKIKDTLLAHDGENWTGISLNQTETDEAKEAIRLVDSLN